MAINIQFIQKFLRSYFEPELPKESNAVYNLVHVLLCAYVTVGEAANNKDDNNIYDATTTVFWRFSMGHLKYFTCMIYLMLIIILYVCVIAPNDVIKV